MRYHRPIPILVMFIALTLVTLACALAGTGSRSATRYVTIHNRLPTLTRTPLPALTSTPDPAAQTIPAEVAVAPPTFTPLPPLPPTLPPVSNEPVVAPQPNSGLATLIALVGLNIRTGPGIDYPIVGKLAQGQSAQIMGKNPEGTWWQIIYPPDGGNPAWVSGDAQYSTANNVEAVQIAQLPPPPLPPPAPPTDVPAAQPIQTPAPAEVPVAQLPAPTAEPTGSPTGSPPASPNSDSPGWAFNGVRVYPDQAGLVLYGNAINNTGAPQELKFVSGTFYDAQGQVVAAADKTNAYWPAYVVPAGGNVPFELAADDITSATRFDLNAEAEPSSEVPRQDFEFSDIDQKNEDNAYCVKGKIRTPEDGFEEYLIIAVVLYDAQNNVVNFGDYGEFGEGAGAGDDKLDFKICVTPPNQEVARYELRAWGL